MRPAFKGAPGVSILCFGAMLLASIAYVATDGSTTLALLVFGAAAALPMYWLDVEPAGWILAGGVLVASVLLAATTGVGWFAAGVGLPWLFTWVRATGGTIV